MQKYCAKGRTKNSYVRDQVMQMDVNWFLHPRTHNRRNTVTVKQQLFCYRMN